MALAAKKNIVILGGGFGGVACALWLSRSFLKDPQLKNRYAIVLVDRNIGHLFPPNLYEMATSVKEDVRSWDIEQAATIRFEDIFFQKPIRILQDTVQAVDIQRKQVTLASGSHLSFSYCILALGSVTNFFGIPGAQEHSYQLKTLQDAIRLRNALEHTVKTRGGNIVIVGAGSTGVELAGELSGFMKRLKRLFPNEWKRTSVHMVEIAPRILPGFPDHVVRSAHRRLERLDVRIHTRAMVTKITKTEVFVQFQEERRHEETFDYSVVIWTGGIAVNPAIAPIVAPKDKKGRCLVDTAMRVGGAASGVFAVGDICCFTDPVTQQPIPANAYVAIAEGKIAARNILSAIRNAEPVHFQPPKVFPFIIPIAGKYAIAHLGWITLSGFPGFTLRLLVDLRYFASVLPLSKAFALWFRNIKIFFKND